MVYHKDLTAEDIHICYSFLFNSKYEMDNIDWKKCSEKDIGKLARCTENEELYMLINNKPIIWKKIGESDQIFLKCPVKTRFKYAIINKNNCETIVKLDDVNIVSIKFTFNTSEVIWKFPIEYKKIRDNIIDCILDGDYKFTNLKKTI